MHTCSDTLIILVTVPILQASKTTARGQRKILIACCSALSTSIQTTKTLQARSKSSNSLICGAGRCTHGLMVMYSLKISAWRQQLTVSDNQKVSIQWTLRQVLAFSSVPRHPYPQVSSGFQAVITGVREVIVPEIYTGKPIMANG